MTEIHALAGLSADDRSQPHQAAGGRSPFVTALGLSAVVLTVLNLAAAAYLFKAVGEVRAVEERLAELAAVEARIKTRLDGMNNGLQSQFDDQNSDLQARFGALERRFDTLDRSLADMRGTPGWGARAEPASQPVLPEGVELPSPLNDAPVEDPVVAVKPPAAKKPAAEPVRGNSAAYERFETADGKVYYRKVR